MMGEYVVRPGMRFGAENQHGPGDKVLLSPQEAAGFSDKLELIVDASGSTSSPNGSGGGGENPWGKLDAKIVAILEAAELTPELVQAMGDEDLLAVKGVGPASLQLIRGAWA